jgi:predicted TIM-barrel fold metal-dependent hydrolase
MYLEPFAPEVIALIDDARAHPTVDAHQHLGPEAPVEIDLCRMLMHENYVLTDLVTAGLRREDITFIDDAAQPVAARWERLAPYWRQVQHGSYARAILLTLRKSYGAHGLATAAEAELVSARLAEDFAAPGLFRRVFLGRCNIPTVLTQPQFIAGDAPRFHTLIRIIDHADFTSGGAFEQVAGMALTSAEDLVPAMDAILHRAADQGAVGFKMAALPWQMPTAAEVAAAFATRERGTSWGDPLTCLYASRAATIAAERNLVVAVHSSAPWTNRLDFRIWEPTALIPFLQAFPDTRVDLYHAGMPYGTTASMMAKIFPNLWMNLAWSHIVSPELAMRSIAEWLDLLPLNKVIAFGGDYQNWDVAFTYGHLEIARENIARVLGYRVRAGMMTLDDARAVQRAWFDENPRMLYRLE